MELEPVYERLGARIRERRKNLPMTQGTLAEKLGISRASLANIEAGRQRVLVHQLYSLASALELAPGDLLPLPADTAGEIDWSGLPLPADLKPEQKRQIARMLQGARPESSSVKGEQHGAKSKR